MEQELSRFGELVLGRPGVALMTDLWCAAVGLALLPLRGGEDWRSVLRYIAPGPLVALVLVTVWPRHWFVFILTLIITAFVMWFGLFLITSERRKNILRGVALVLAALALMQVTPRVPDDYSWLAVPLFPIVVLGVPIGLILLIQEVVRHRKWSAPALSSVLFVGAWAVWLARDYFYRLKY